MSLTDFVQGVARSPLGNLPALMQQKQAIERQKKLDMMREQEAEQARQRAELLRQMTGEINTQLSTATNPQQRRQILDEGSLGLMGLGFNDAAKFYQSRGTALGEQMMHQQEMGLKRDLAALEEQGRNRRATMVQQGQDRRQARQLGQQDAHFRAKMHLEEAASARDEQSHQLAMQRGTFELQEAQIASINNDIQGMEQNVAGAWLDFTQGGSVQGFLDSQELINGQVRQNPGLFQKVLGLEDHRIPQGVELAPHPVTGLPMVSFDIHNTKTGTTGPMTERGTAEASDQVVAVPLSSFNRRMQTMLGGDMKDPEQLIRDNIESLFKEGGLMAATPEGRKDQQIAVQNLALEAYEWTGDVKVAEKIANLFLNGELPEVKAFWNARTAKQKASAQEDLIALVSMFKRFHIEDRMRNKGLPKAKVTVGPLEETDDTRRTMPKRENRSGGLDSLLNGRRPIYPNVAFPN